MKNAILSPKAKSDLKNIYHYTATRWDAGQADAYVTKIWNAVSVVTENPLMGVACDDIRKGYYKYPAGEHRIYYYLTKDGITIVRILHGRMNFIQHLT